MKPGFLTKWSKKAKNTFRRPKIMRGLSGNSECKTGG